MWRTRGLGVVTRSMEVLINVVGVAGVYRSESSVFILFFRFVVLVFSD